MQQMKEGGGGEEGKRERERERETQRSGGQENYGTYEKGRSIHIGYLLEYLGR